jgi:hypothetical protein
MLAPIELTLTTLLPKIEVLYRNKVRLADRLSIQNLSRLAGLRRLTAASSKSESGHASLACAAAGG